VSFSPKPRPRRVASAERSRARSSAPFQLRSLSKSARRRTTPEYPSRRWTISSTASYPRSVVQLDDRVEALGEEMAADRGDLVGPAAVERRERDGVREPRVAGHVREPAQRRGQSVTEGGAFLVEEGRHVPDAVEEILHLPRLQALEAVSDRDVEDRVALAPGHLEKIVEDGDEEPALDVLAEGVGDRELLRPLDVETDGPHVDARPRDHEGVVDLDGLELEDPPAREIRQRDVLGELRVRSGGGPDRRGRPVSVESRGEVPAREPAVDPPDRKVVNGAGRQLRGSAPHQGGERDGPENAHAIRLQSRAASSRARARIRAASTRTVMRSFTISSPPATTSLTCRAPMPKRM